MTEYKLFSHQQEVVDKNPVKCGLWFEMRAGKTPTSIRLACKNLTSCLVVVPKALKEQWEEEIVRWNNTGIDFKVITKETFRRDWDKLERRDGLIIDECFTGETQVKTVNGYKKIEDVGVGDEVCNLTGSGIVINKSCRTVDEILEIRFSDNNIIYVTKNHKFLTTDGWIKAIDLEKKNILLTYNFDNAIMNNIIKAKENGKISNRDCLSNLWGKIFIKKIQTKQGMQKEIMQKESKKYDSYSGDEEESRLVKNFFRKYEKMAQRKSSIRKEVITKNETEQSDEESADKGEGKAYIKKNWTQTKSQRWQRQGNAYTTENIISSPWRWLVCRACSVYKNGFTKYSVQLQNRYSEPKTNDSNRGRWKFTQLTKEERTRQKKDKNPYFVRVESIQIQKQRSDGKTKNGFKVYNLEVSNHPSYIVNNYYVHNCHIGFANHKSKMYKSGDSYIKKWKIEYIWLLTGTPYTSSAWSIYSLGNLLGQNWNWMAWNKRFFNRIQMGYYNKGGMRLPRMVYVQKTGIEEEIARITNKIGITKKLADVTDLPPEMFINEYYDLNKQQKDKIKEQWDALPIVRFTAQHQIESGTLKGDGYTESQTFDCDKTQRVIELAKEHKKIIIVCRYNLQIQMYYDRIKRECGKNVYIINGETKNRHEVVTSAESDSSCVVLVNAYCNAGYSLKSFSVMVFASLSFSFVDYSQMCRRINDITKKEPNLYIHLLTRDNSKKVPSMDKAVMTAINNKQDFDIAIFNR